MGQYGNQPDFGTKALAITPKGFAGGAYTNVVYKDGDGEIQTVYLTNSSLNVSTLNDGTPIPKAVDQAAWDTYTNSNAEPCWAYYDFDDANAVYGKVYNKYAAQNAGLYSAGYGLLDSAVATLMANPSKNPTLGQELKSIPTGIEGQDVTGTTLWEWKSGIPSGTDVFGFTALPGGFYDGDTWNRINNHAPFWDNTTDYIYRMLYNEDVVNRTTIEASDAGYYIRLQVDPTNVEYVEPQPLNSAALYVGTGGDLVVTIVGSKTPVMFKNVPDASFLPIIVSHVWERGDDGLTTASDIIAIY